MATSQDYIDTLHTFTKKCDFFVGIDSDGCVFDTMEIKHKECFTPNFIKYFKMQAVSKYAREAWDFVNLYSKTRGCNRFLALNTVLTLLGERDVVKARGVSMPDKSHLVSFIESGKPLGNEALAEEKAGNAFLELCYEWSINVNKTVEDMVEGVPPFPFVRESLTKIEGKADMMVVSQTPTEALTREWQEHDIEKHVQIIAGQEMGKKSEHLIVAAGDKYEHEKKLMIGDAPGDRKAAEDANCLFYPINPGNEEASWERFHGEALDKFFAGTYAGDYEAKLIKEFESYLPELPPWKH